MGRHRFLDLLNAEPAVPAAETPATLGGFMACPMVLQTAAWSWQQNVYQLAFEQARAVVRPSRLERWQRPSAN
jgi:hypothetical protein